MARKFLGAIAPFLYAPGATSGYVLTSDASGNGTWQAPAAGGAGNILDGGNASSTYVGGPTFDCGHAT